METIISHSTVQTEEAGVKFANSFSENFPFVAIYGELGAGKTSFVRGLVSVLSPGSKVKSPSYTIVNEYSLGPKPVYHFDLYRLSSAEEIYDIGFGDYLDRGVCICEWSERLGDDLPDGTVRVEIEKLDDASRKITINHTLDGAKS